MFVAAFIIHGQDSFQKQELALAYLAAYVALLFTGPGRFSLDSFMRR
jgi:putative oxidoreductase